jgi:hypothetical protein
VTRHRRRSFPAPRMRFACSRVSRDR